MSASAHSFFLAAVVAAWYLWHVPDDRAFLSWDDHANFVANPHIRRLDRDSVWWLLRHGVVLGVYEPVALLLKTVQVALGGGVSAVVLLRTSAIVHALNAALAARVAEDILVYVLPLPHAPRTKAALAAPPPSAAKARHAVRASCSISALLFALHPLRVEVVAWSSCQPYLWATFFALASVRLLVAAAELRRRGSGSSYDLSSSTSFSASACPTPNPASTSTATSTSTSTSASTSTATANATSTATATSISAHVTVLTILAVLAFFLSVMSKSAAVPMVGLAVGATALGAAQQRHTTLAAAAAAAGQSRRLPERVSWCRLGRSLVHGLGSGIAAHAGMIAVAAAAAYLAVTSNEEAMGLQSGAATDTLTLTNTLHDALALTLRAVVRAATALCWYPAATAWPLWPNPLSLIYPVAQYSVMNEDGDGSGAAYISYARLVVAVTLTVKSMWILIGFVRAPAEASAALVATWPATSTVSTPVETATMPTTPITTATVTAMPPSAGPFQWDLGRLLAAAWIANLILVAPMLGFIQHGDPPSIVFDRYAYLPGALVVVPLVAACLEFLLRWQGRENRHPNSNTISQTQQVPSSAAPGHRSTDDRASRQLLAGQRSNAAAGTCNTTTGVGTFCTSGAIESDSSDNDEEDNDSIDRVRTFSGTRIVMCVAAVALAGCVHVCGERLREWSTSYDLWTMAVRTNPDLPHAHLGLARVHRTQHRLTDATRAFEAAYALAPRHASTAADALFERAEVMRDTGSRAEDVAAVMAEAVAVNPRFAKAHVGCGLIHWNTGHKDKAISSMQRALEAQPGYVAAVLNLASLHGSARNWIAAKTVLLDGIQWQTRERTGIMYEMLGDVIKAAARSASTAGSERTARHTSNSVLALPSGVADEVAGAYTEALVLTARGGGDDAKLLRKLGKLYLGQRMFNEAVDFLERAVREEKPPSNGRISQNVGLLEQARAGKAGKKEHEKQ